MGKYICAVSSLLLHSGASFALLRDGILYDLIGFLLKLWCVCCLHMYSIETRFVSFPVLSFL